MVTFTELDQLILSNKLCSPILITQCFTPIQIPKSMYSTINCHNFICLFCVPIHSNSTHQCCHRASFAQHLHIINNNSKLLFLSSWFNMLFCVVGSPSADLVKCMNKSRRTHKSLTRASVCHLSWFLLYICSHIHNND